MEVREYESMNNDELATRWGAICYWEGTNLNHDVYLLDCIDIHEAFTEAYRYFMQFQKDDCFWFRKIERIEIKKQGTGLYDTPKGTGTIKNYLVPPEPITTPTFNER